MGRITELLTESERIEDFNLRTFKAKLKVLDAFTRRVIDSGAKLVIVESPVHPLVEANIEGGFTKIKGYSKLLSHMKKHSREQGYSYVSL